MVVDVLAAHRVQESGRPDGRPMVLVHGFGCDQHMWRQVAPRFEDEFRVVTLDLAGSGGADPSTYDVERHASLQGYADDVLAICRDLDLHDAVLVGHSVSSMIGALVVTADPDRFAQLVMVCPSARYIDDGDYVGGFSEQDVTELLDSLDSNYLGWSSAMAPVVMGNPDEPALGQELTESFCRTDPEIARRFAEVTFTGDNRADLPRVDVPTLVLQTRQDALAPVEVGRYVADHLPRGELVLLDATGHCPHMSAPAETAAAISTFLHSEARATT